MHRSCKIFNMNAKVFHSWNLLHQQALYIRWHHFYYSNFSSELVYKRCDIKNFLLFNIAIQLIYYRYSAIENLFHLRFHIDVIIQCEFSLYFMLSFVSLVVL